MLDPGFSISRDHGKFFDKQGTLFMATYHPAALLRYPNKQARCLWRLCGPAAENNSRSATIPIKKIPPDDKEESGMEPEALALTLPIRRLVEFLLPHRQH